MANCYLHAIWRAGIDKIIQHSPPSLGIVHQGARFMTSCMSTGDGLECGEDRSQLYLSSLAVYHIFVGSLGFQFNGTYSTPNP